MIAEPLLAAAQAWLADDPDPATRAELEALLAPDGDHRELARRFAGRLQFGTAGLRGPLGAGPMAMNRVTVRRAAAGFARYLLDTVPGAATAGVVIGYDARRQSDVFALDSAAVFAGAGFTVHLLTRSLPTPVVAFAIGSLGACAGVMVTASHNPPADNGYKVYLADGSQIVPPQDVDIAARIDAVGALSTVAMVDPEHERKVHRGGVELIDAYVAHAVTARLVDAELPAVSVAYTALHGVGADVIDAVFAAVGYAPVHHVVEQRRPDGRFPTVSFPNPEEPGAMDLLLAEAIRVDADVALANDPDADRLGVAIPTGAGGRRGWRALTGDEIGALIADHVLAHTSGADRLVVTTYVSSTLLAQMAADAGVHHAETATGFKWIAQAIRDRPGQRFVFGYEQALGYLVSDAPRDKDGITAAVVVTEIAALAKRDGVTLEQRLDDIARRFGRHRTAERSLRLDSDAAARAVARLLSDPPTVVAGRAVVATSEPAPGLLRLQLDAGARVQARPSGTEPKVKVYAEAIDADPVPLADALAALLSAR